MLIFSYGSNLCVERIRRRTASVTPVTVARLPGHDFRFHKRSPDGSAKADAFETGGKADAVWGAVYRIDPIEKPALDRAEGLGRGYREKVEPVLGVDGRTHYVQLYVATDLDPERAPYAWYKRYVVEGARRHGLPEEYVQSIEAAPSRPDPDPARAARHSQVIC